MLLLLLHPNNDLGGYIIEVCTVYYNNNIVIRSLCYIIGLYNIHDDVCLDTVLPENRNIAIVVVPTYMIIFCTYYIL